MKLRSKYIGPFKVIKTYTYSFILVPRTENSRLEEYYKDTDAFRLMHRGDIKPFYTRQAAVKHCKPYKGSIETEHIVDPIMLTRFLDMLGVDSQDDLISEIDHDRDGSTSSDSGDPRHPRPPRNLPSDPSHSHHSSDDSDNEDDQDEEDEVPPPND